jgi:hypothetical protein
MYMHMYIAGDGAAEADAGRAPEPYPEYYIFIYTLMYNNKILYEYT